MARPLRLPYAGGVYHVMARGNDRKAVVRDDRDRARFVDTLAQMGDRYRVRCAVGARLVTDRPFRRRVKSALDVKVKT